MGGHELRYRRFDKVMDGRGSCWGGLGSLLFGAWIMTVRNRILGLAGPLACCRKTDRRV
jgi:hypothetical protein